MREGIISVGFNAAAEAADRFSIRRKLHFGGAGNQQPMLGVDVARREAKRLIYAGLSQLIAT
jgi:hypothetical protein